MSFRENLRTELNYQKMKTKDLAAKTGINKRTLDGYLAARSYEPTLSNAMAIAKALNVSVEYLGQTDDDMFQELTDSTETVNNSEIDTNELSAKYKKLPEDQRKIVMDLINSLLK